MKLGHIERWRESLENFQEEATALERRTCRFEIQLGTERVCINFNQRPTFILNPFEKMFEVFNRFTDASVPRP